MRIVIDADFAGRTVKDWLYSHGVSRSLITRLKKLEDGITVNGEHATVRRLLACGDCLSLALSDREADENDALIPTPMPLDILYEDDDLIAVSKPPDMATHPSLGHFTDTLANGLCYYFHERGQPFVFRAVNRLDRDTSGIVLVAKNQLAASELTALMQCGRIRKTYIAVLNGVLNPPAGRIDANIRRREESIMLREVCTGDGQTAVTAYETICAAADGSASVVRAEPITGRTHQLRVHFASRGCPIAGDGLYGSAETEPTPYDRALTRHALHAASLTVLRESGALTLNAPLPEDIRRLCEQIKGTKWL
ncbi:MAG: RluA family pseudouridine synthase [Clostridia bacterium]|nr:RluA family pseudouridine synthase [Clostridia bacterium]